MTLFICKTSSVANVEQPNLQPGNIVLQEIDPSRTHWPLARILETYPGMRSCCEDFLL